MEEATMAELVQVTVDGDAMNLVTAVPDGDGPFPAVVITIHGGGIDDFEHDIADKLAAEGYIAAGHDIFHWQKPVPTDSAERRGNLRDDQLIKDMNASLGWIEGTGKADMGRVGILGHCMGGRASYLGACVNPVFRCAVVYYGGNMFVPWGEGGPSPFDRLENLKVPVIGFYGNDDKNPSPDDVNKIDAELTRLGVDHEFHRYDGAGHAFQNFLADSYREEQTKDSWAKTVKFLNAQLG
jgi:carboxymethylenebutenolidase